MDLQALMLCCIRQSHSEVAGIFGKVDCSDGVDGESHNTSIDLDFQHPRIDEGERVVIETVGFSLMEYAMDSTPEQERHGNCDRKDDGPTDHRVDIDEKRRDTDGQRPRAQAKCSCRHRKTLSSNGFCSLACASRLRWNIEFSHGPMLTEKRSNSCRSARELPMASSLHKYRAWHMLEPMHESDSHGSPRKRRVRLFRNGRNQAIRIPKDFELEGDEALIRRDGDRLIIEPVHTGKLLALLASMEPITEPFPDVGENLGILDDFSL